MANRQQMTATTSIVSNINQSAIVHALREHGPMTRAAIGEVTGLSLTTVNRLAKDLLTRGTIARHGQEASTGGRPSVILRYAGDPGVVIGLHLRRDRVIGAVVDLGGNVMVRHERPVAPVGGAGGSQPETDRLQPTLELLDQLMASVAGLDRTCMSVGLAVPGVVTDPGGRIGAIPSFGWPNMPLGELLHAHTGLPVVVENDANAHAYGEFRRGAGVGASNVVALMLENGMGAGIVTDGAISHGYHAAAGEIGYLLMDRSSLGHTYTNVGDLESRVGSVSLTRQALERGMALPAGASVSAHDIINMAQHGDPIAGEMAEELLDFVAMALAAVCVILDPEVIVVGSGLSVEVEIVPQLEARLEGRIRDVPQLRRSTIGDDSILIGVSELAIKKVDQVNFVP